MVIWLIALIASIKQRSQLYAEPAIMMIGFAELGIFDLPLMFLVARAVG